VRTYTKKERHHEQIFRSTESSKLSAARVNGQSTDRTRLETDRGLNELADRSNGGLEVALFWHPARESAQWRPR
jgi:hypothetical protein